MSLFLKNFKKKNKNEADKIVEIGIVIPLSKKIKLLNIAEVYWTIETWANLKCKFDKPNIILFSLIVEINGKWYRPASGLFEWSKTIIKNEIDPIIKVNLHKIFNCFLSLKINIKKIIERKKIILLIFKLNAKKKLMIKDIKLR